MEVFLLQHECEQSDEPKLLGVFKSFDDAQEAMLTYTTLPGFQKYLDGFSIDRYVVGQKHWAEGFIRN